MMNRRHFIRITASATAAASLMSFPFIVRGAGKQVVIIGGGAGGATAARYIRELDDSIEVTLIEPKEHYHTCFMSNEVLSGERSIESIQFNYQGLTKHGVKVIPSRATAIDPEAKKVTLENGDSVSYERLIVSPGIDFKWDAIEGYD
ncbi:MAG: FAD/NAD(P)-binding oxidoreductase, partial [Pseudomonadota bacterium]|nr:FAD/NAD(P)-binding oxidoreductase [Pseudomonadota bacterium]